MRWIICCAGLADGRHHAAEGKYVLAFDPDGSDGGGDVTWTPDYHAAKKFESAQAATAFWGQESKVKPLRADGLPNRPLTAFNIELVIYGFDEPAREEA